MNALQFHRSTQELLGIELRVSEQRLRTITNRERVCNRQFPKAVREWFAIDEVETIFFRHTNSDHLTDHRELGDPSDIQQGYVLLATENQHVLGWYALLDGSDDPPVFHNNNEWEEDLSIVPWVLNSITFTSFIFDAVSQFHFGGWNSCVNAIDPHVVSAVRRWKRLTNRPGART